MAEGPTAGHPVRVLALVNTYLPGYLSGGPVRSMSGLVHWLGDEVPISIITRDRDKDGVPYSGIQRGVWQPVGKASVYYAAPNELGLRAMYRIIAGREFDILYLNSFLNPVFGLRPLLLRRLGLLRGKRTIIAPRGEFATAARRIKPLKKLAYTALLRRLGMLKGLTWQASSEAEAAEIRQGIGPSAVVTIARNLTPMPELTLDDDRRAKSAGKLRIVFLSRIAPMKNLIGALQAVARIQGDLTLDIYGPVDDRVYWRECQEAVGRMPPNVKVKYCGPVEHERARSVLSGYDLFILPTLGENFGHAILDALVAGCPVLISDRTPWRKLAASGIGWDVPLEDADAMTDRLQQALEAGAEDWQAMRERARAYGLRHAGDPEAVRQNRQLFADPTAR